MNNDLISRSELKQVLCEFMKNNIGIYSNEMFHLVDSMPTAEERPQGKWITLDRNDRFKTGLYKCNLCGYKNPVPDEASKNFCPNCGADMRGGKEK